MELPYIPLEELSEYKDTRENQDPPNPLEDIKHLLKPDQDNHPIIPKDLSYQKLLQLIGI